MTTLKEFKEAVLSYIEEHDPNAAALTKDVDIADKINMVINLKQHEMMRYKKIEDKEVMDVEEDEEIELNDIDPMCYQVKKITGVQYEPNGKYITFKEDGTANIYYYKYPKKITEDTSDEDYKFELDPEVLEIMKVGVAADLLKMDISNRYGQIFDQEYQRLLQSLDPRYNAGIITFENGVDV